MDAAGRFTYSRQLVDMNGIFNENIDQYLNLTNEKGRVVVVSIIGPQNDGKSTLCNHLFSTDFQMMDSQSQKGMQQTTRGIWIAEAPEPKLPNGDKILVIDTEGSDGMDRGQEGNDTFERKTAAFALSVSDVVMLNTKCENVGKHRGSSLPLLETVIEILFRRSKKPKHVYLLIILRDKNECSLDGLEKQLKEKLELFWGKMSRPEAYRNAALKDYFTIEVMLLPHYVYKKDDFVAEMPNMRKKIFEMVNLSGQSRGELGPASGFVALASENWRDINMNRDLNVQLNKATVAHIHCNEIKKKMIDKFDRDETWKQMNSDVRSGKVVEKFGKKVDQLIAEYRSQYDWETNYYDKGARLEHRKELNKHLFEAVEDTYLFLVGRMREETLEKFKKEIVTTMKARDKLEKVKSDEYITELRVLLKDANVIEAYWWTHNNEEIKKFKHEIASYREAAEDVYKKVLELKRIKVMALATVAGVIVSGTAVGLTAGLAAPAIGGGAVAISAVALPSIEAAHSILATVMETCSYNKKKQQLKEECGQDKVKGDIMSKYKS